MAKALTAPSQPLKFLQMSDALLSRQRQKLLKRAVVQLVVFLVAFVAVLLWQPNNWSYWAVGALGVAVFAFPNFWEPWSQAYHREILASEMSALGYSEAFGKDDARSVLGRYSPSIGWRIFESPHGWPIYFGVTQSGGGGERENFSYLIFWKLPSNRFSNLRSYRFGWLFPLFILKFSLKAVSILLFILAAVGTGLMWKYDFLEFATAAGIDLRLSMHAFLGMAVIFLFSLRYGPDLIMSSLQSWLPKLATDVYGSVPFTRVECILPEGSNVWVGISIHQPNGAELIPELERVIINSTS